jgi:hypothetical protein
MKKFEKELERIHEVLATFLKENGGLHNGYSTFVEGVVAKRASTMLNWSTPICGKLSIDDHRKLGEKIYSKIKNILIEEDIEECEITKTHIEYGIFETKIKLVESKVLII